jgi:large subunit ribosomal protein L28
MLQCHGYTGTLSQVQRFNVPTFHVGLLGARAVAKECAICGKRPGTGNAVSHSAVKTGRRFLPNLQKVRVLVDGAPRRLKV